MIIIIMIVTNYTALLMTSSTSIGNVFYSLYPVRRGIYLSPPSVYSTTAIMVPNAEIWSVVKFSEPASSVSLQTSRLTTI